MPELRWTLAVLGALFVVGLALWELRRQRQVPRQTANPGTPAGSERIIPTLEGSIGEGARLHREPTIILPELHPEPPVEPRLTARRESAHDPPVVEVDEASFSRLHVEGATVADEIPAADEDASALSVEERGITAEESGPGLPEAGLSTSPSVRPEPSVQPEEIEAPTGNADSGRSSAVPQEVPVVYAPVGFAGHAEEREAASSGAEQTSATRITSTAAPAHAAGAAAAGAPIVDWPSEASRKIVALRLVSSPAARFPGRAVRQALAAEGFVLGKFDIFHKAGPDERCVLSAASLTKPGTFAMNRMDGQRFGGLSLFAVLPGPLPAQQAFDELLSTARSLNDRLQGALQDERGEPLTPMRSASIRQSLSEDDGSTDGGAGHQSETQQ